MKGALTERAGLLLEMALIEEDPARNQRNWDLNAPDCSDFWDGEGLEPGLEVATFARYQYAVSCLIVAEGQNPFSVTQSGWFEPFHLAEFGYAAFDCVAGVEGTVELYDVYLGEFRTEYYPYQQEESFGAFYTRADGSRLVVAGERSDLQGIFIDADNCLAYLGWPEAIARMVAVNAGETLPHQLGVDDEPGEAEVVVAVSDTPVVFSTFVPPPPTSARSLTSAAVAIVAVVLLLVLRRFTPLTANTVPVSSTPPPGHTSPSRPDGDGREDRSGARRGRRIAVIGALGLGITVVASAFDSAVRSSVTASIVDTGLVGEVLVRWGVPVALMALFATVAVTSLTGTGRLMHPVHGVVSAVAVVVGTVATGWGWLAIPLIPVLALMLSAGVFERVAHHTKVLLLWLGAIVSLIFYSLSLAPGAEGWLPTWSGQLVVICLGMVASSVALLSVPLPGFLGRDSYQTHPLMWAGAMVLSLWLTLTLSGGAWPLLVAVGAVVVGVVVLSTVFFTGEKAFAKQQ